MLDSLLSYRDYKIFLKDLVSAAPARGRGMRQKLAIAAGCQLPYVSHVLNGDYHFSAEHIDGIGKYLQLRDYEREFLLLLVQSQRASTTSLKTFYKNLIAQLVQRHSSLQDRLQTKESLSNEDRTIYYSIWHFAAIHMLVTIPEFQTRIQIADHLRISVNEVNKAADFLISKNLIQQKSGRLIPTSTALHIERDSPHVRQHHTNWRLRAIDSFADERDQDLHYSLAFTISENDLPKVREILMQALEKCAAIIRPSEEQKLAALCVDLFAIGLQS